MPPEGQGVSDGEPSRTEAEQKEGAAGVPAPDTAPDVASPEVQLRCPECGRENPPDCIFCLNCGAMLPVAAPALAVAGPKKPRRRRALILVLFACLGLVLFLYVVTPSSAGLLNLEYALGRRNFDGADRRGAYLFGADLFGADLSDANLRGADLTGAKVTDKELARAKSLTGATMPDGSVHE